MKNKKSKTIFFLVFSIALISTIGLSREYKYKTNNDSLIETSRYKKSFQNSNFPFTVTCNSTLKRITGDKRIPKNLEEEEILFINETVYGVLVVFDKVINIDNGDDPFDGGFYIATVSKEGTIIQKELLIDSNCDAVNYGSDGSSVKSSEQKVSFTSTSEFSTFVKIDIIENENQTKKNLSSVEKHFRINQEGKIILSK